MLKQIEYTTYWILIIKICGMVIKIYNTVVCKKKVFLEVAEKF